MKTKQRTKQDKARIRIAKHLMHKYSLNIPTRLQSIVYQRYYLYYELRKICTYQEIGDIFDKDHASVLHGIKMHEAWMLVNDRQYVNTISEIKEDFETQMMEGFSKSDELRIVVDDIFQNVVTLNLKMKVNRDFMDKLPDIKTFQDLHEAYLEYIY